MIRLIRTKQITEQLRISELKQPALWDAIRQVIVLTEYRIWQEMCLSGVRIGKEIIRPIL